MTAKASSCRWHTDSVFSLARPTAEVIERQIDAAGDLPAATPHFMSLSTGLEEARSLSFGFVHDFSRLTTGSGEAVFAAARKAFERWVMFELGWVRVANPAASIAVGEVVAVEVRALGLWSINLSRIQDVVDTRNRFGFLYATTEMHVEEGEERFLIELNPDDGKVSYVLEAVSRPRNSLARMGFPVTGYFQHRFARDSHRLMREAVEQIVTSP
jgi:uncharacterized protein (UPF0548 family)